MAPIAEKAYHARGGLVSFHDSLCGPDPAAFAEVVLRELDEVVYMVGWRSVQKLDLLENIGSGLGDQDAKLRWCQEH